MICKDRSNYSGTPCSHIEMLWNLEIWGGELRLTVRDLYILHSFKEHYNWPEFLKFMKLSWKRSEEARKEQKRF